jgi:hypothetical protein
MNLISAKLWVTIAILIPLSGTVISSSSSTALGDTIQCIREASCYGSSTPDSDVIIGSELQPEMIFALAGDDVVYAFGGSDHINGDEGSDSIDAGPGSDVVDSGSGGDTVVGGEDHDRLDGNSGNDHVLGGAGSNIISGSIGDDNLVGNEGDDYLYGGPGGDQFRCNSRMDTIHGYSQAEGDKIISEADCEIVKRIAVT